MKLSKIFHFLYFSVLAIPLVTIPIFAIYSQNHEINDNTLQVTYGANIDFNQQIEYGQFYESSDISKWQVNGLTLSYSNHSLKIDSGTGNSFYTQTYVPDAVLGHMYLVRYDLVAIGQTTGGFGYGGNYQTQAFTFDTTLKTYGKTFYPNSTNKTFYVYNNAQYTSYLSNLMLFDLTQMFGRGNEPTYDKFNEIFNESYYEYNLSKEIYVENVGTTTYNDTDIMSQFMYLEYNFMDKYLGMYKYQPFSGIYSWLSNTFFGGSAPLVFTIFYQWFSYWLFVSLCWLIFDVLIYIPMVAHRWLDKGALE